MSITTNLHDIQSSIIEGRYTVDERGSHTYLTIIIENIDKTGLQLSSGHISFLNLYSRPSASLINRFLASGYAHRILKNSELSALINSPVGAGQIVFRFKDSSSYRIWENDSDPRHGDILEAVSEELGTAISSFPKQVLADFNLLKLSKKSVKQLVDSDFLRYGHQKCLSDHYESHCKAIYQLVSQLVDHSHSISIVRTNNLESKTAESILYSKLVVDGYQNLTVANFNKLSPNQFKIDSVCGKKCIILWDCDHHLIERVLNLAKRGTVIVLAGTSLFGSDRQSFNIIDQQETVGEILIIPAIVPQLATALVSFLEYYSPQNSLNLLLVDCLVRCFTKWLLEKAIGIKNERDISFYQSILYLANEETNVCEEEVA